MQRIESNHVWMAAAILLTLLLTLAPRPAQAQTTVYWVTNTSTGGPGSLSAALGALQDSHAGWQEIRFGLPSGTTSIALSGGLPTIRGPRVRITGMDNPSRLILDGNYSAIFVVAADSTTNELRIDGLHLQRGGRIGGGGCLTVLKGAIDVRVEDVHFDRCRGYVGDGIPARGGAVLSRGGLQVSDSQFTGNTILNVAGVENSADGRGGAMSIEGNRPVTLSRNLFQDNRIYLINSLPSFCAGGHGGALSIDMVGNTAAQVLDSTFIGNSSSCRNPTVTYDINGAGDGGAIVLYGRGDYLIERNYFEANHGRRGGALLADQAHFSNLHVANNTFYRNRANASGGGLAVINCCATWVDHNTFVENEGLSTNYGSQFAITGSPIYSIRYNAFSGSTPVCTSSFINFTQDIGRNAYSDAGCGFTETATLTGMGAMTFFEAPAMTGGEVLTMRPHWTSPVVDYGSANEACARLYDARGVPRPLDGNGDSTPACDIGAVEASYPDVIFANGFQ